MKGIKKLRHVVSILVVTILVSLVGLCSVAYAFEEVKAVEPFKVWTATFNKALDARSVNEQNVFVKDSEGNVVPVKVGLGKDGTSIIINPPEGGYTPGKQYTLVISDQVRSIYGHRLSQPYLHTFTILKKSTDSLKVYRSSDYFQKEFIEIEIMDNKEISVKGRAGLDKDRCWFIIQNKDWLSVVSETMDILPDGRFEGKFPIENLLEDGDYEVYVYFRANGRLEYYAYYYGIPLKCEGGNIYFPETAVYKHNYEMYTANSNADPKQYLSLGGLSDSELNELKQLAYKIIAGAKTDYEKLLKIHDWVAQNIYYDYDAYRGIERGRTDAYGTYVTKRSVCQGYAELTNVLLRIVGIPSRIVIGHVIWKSQESWNQVNHNISNHAWNEAFVDGRWVILDVTWDSGNKYEYGNYEKGDIDYVYFDPNLRAFSLDHKILIYR